MSNRIKIEMNETLSGLIGWGDIILECSNNGVKSAIYFVPKHKIEIKLSEQDASKIFERIVMQSEFDVNTLLRFATESCNIQLFRIKEKSRNKEIVFARYLVIWYVKKYMEYSFAQAGSIFGKNHCTAIHGFRTIDNDPKFLNEEQKVWRRAFMNKLVENRMLDRNKKY